MRQTITQEDSMGCGAACVAFAANKTYRHVSLVLGEEKARSVGFKLKEIIDALNHYGLNYRAHHVKLKGNLKSYQEGTIVFIKRSSRYPYGHYLIKHGELWADPWINLVIDNRLNKAKSGYRQRLPGQVQWILQPVVKAVDEQS